MNCVYDEKRRLVKGGDEIKFACPDENRPPLSVQVIALHRFDSFAALYAALPLLQCGYYITKSTARKQA